MPFALLLLFAFAPLGPHWVTRKDSYRVHRAYVTHYGNTIGDYYQPIKPTFQARDVAVPFTAQCLESAPVEFNTESQATVYVENCPR